MKMALDLASEAAAQGETPIAAIVVDAAGKVLGTGYNQVELDHDPTAHAEIVAIRVATRCMGDWRLRNATLYVTIEPCIMCAGALLHARIRRVVFGARDPRWGGLGSLFDFAHDPRINHRLEVMAGVLESESLRLMHNFFSALRRDAREVEGG